MRRINITKLRSDESCERGHQHAEDTARQMSFWASLSTAGLSTGGIAFQDLLLKNSRFVIALARQYRDRGLNQEELLVVAHRAFLAQLNQLACLPNPVEKVSTIALRNALLIAIEEEGHSK